MIPQVEQCQHSKTDEKTFREARSELIDFVALADTLPLSVKTSVYELIKYELCVLHDLLKQCETPEQQSLGLALYQRFQHWSHGKTWINFTANTYVQIDSGSVDADLLVQVMSTKHDQPILQAIVITAREPNQGVNAGEVEQDQECLTRGILVFRFTRSDAVHCSLRCADIVEHGLRRIFTAHQRTGWPASQAPKR